MGKKTPLFRIAHHSFLAAACHCRNTTNATRTYKNSSYAGDLICRPPSSSIYRLCNTAGQQPYLSDELVSFYHTFKFHYNLGLTISCLFISTKHIEILPPDFVFCFVLFCFVIFYSWFRPASRSLFDR